MKNLNLATLLLVFLFVSCSQKKDNVTPKKVKSTDSQYYNYVEAYTKGVISSKDPIRIVFSKSLNATDLKKLVTVSTEKSAFGLSSEGRILSITPESVWSSKERINYKIDLKVIYPDISNKDRYFEKLVTVKKQNFDLVSEGLKITDASVENQLTFYAELNFADAIELSEVKKLVSADIGVKNYTVEVSPLSNSSFQLAVPNIERGESKKELVLTVKSDGWMDVKTIEERVEILPKGSYQVQTAKVIYDKSNYISVLFSQPLNPNQNFKGKIKINGRFPKFRVESNELKIFTKGYEGNIKLELSRTISSIFKELLKEDYVDDLSIDNVKPQLQAYKSQGSIVPENNPFIYKFKARGLNAVDIRISKVSSDNLLQYLQVNAYGQQYEMTRVSIPILSKRVSLMDMGITDLNKWNNFHINLEDLYDFKKGELYQVEVGFQSAYANFYCGEEKELENTIVLEEETSYWDNYEPSYNWRERDNPCHPAYYNSSKMLSSRIVSSNIGIIAQKNEGEDLWVYATSLKTGEPLQGAEVSIYGYSQVKLNAKKADQDGAALFDLAKEAYFVEVKQGADRMILRLKDGKELNTSNFNISGTKIQNGLKGFSYTERGVRRPGDTINVGFIANLAEFEKNQNIPVNGTLYNPKGVVVGRFQPVQNQGKHFRFSIPTQKEDLSGKYIFKIRAGVTEFSQVLPIENIKPNRLKINLDSDLAEMNSKTSKAKFRLSSSWLTGIKASGLNADVELTYGKGKVEFKKYDNYTFDNLHYELDKNSKIIYEGNLDKNGEASFSYEFSKTKNLPSQVNLDFFTKVYEQGGDFSFMRSTIPYKPYDSYAGLLVPEGDKRGMLQTDKDYQISLVRLNSDGALKKGKVRVELYKLQWRWWWDNSYEDLSNYFSYSYRKPVKKQTISLNGGRGTYKLNISNANWGRYYLKVTDLESGHQSGKIVYVDWPGWAGKSKSNGVNGAAIFDFESDKESYQVGEKVKLKIPTANKSKLFVSIQSSSKVIESRWINSSPEFTDFEFEVTKEMTPNIYIQVSKVQTMDNLNKDIPVRTYGYHSVEITNSNELLNPVIVAPESIKPSSDFDLTISEKNGQDMTYTLAVVEEGILDLTNFQTADPYKAFHAKEALGIKTFDLYDELLTDFGGNIGYNLAIGGDEASSKPKKVEPNRYESVVKFLGPFTLGVGEQKTHKIHMPEYIGAVRVMVVANSQEAAGSSDKTIQVKQPLMILGTLPRSLGYDEEFDFPVNIFALQDGIGKVNITLSTEGEVRPISKQSMVLNLEKAGDTVVNFKLRSKEATGNAFFQVTAESSDNSAVYKANLKVDHKNPIRVNSSKYLLEPGETKVIEYTPIGIAGSNQASFSFSSLPPLNLEKRMDYLIRYPYGCIEQTTSSVFPQLMLEDLTKLSANKKKEIQRNIENGLDRLVTFQLNSGGLSYWPGNDKEHEWGSVYAFHFLVKAKEQGYYIPENLYDGLKEYLLKRADAWNSNSDYSNSQFTQAYRLYVLALSNSASLGAMNRLSGRDLNHQEKALLIMSYKLAGVDTEAQSLYDSWVNETPSQNRDSKNSYVFYSRLRNKAMNLETHLLMDNSLAAYDILIEISERLSSDKWLSTQETAYSLVSVSNYSSGVKEYSDNAFTLKEISGSSSSFDLKSYNLKYSIDNADQKKTYEIKNTSESGLYINAVSLGLPKAIRMEASSSGLRLRANYLDLNNVPLNIDNLKPGTQFKVRLSVTSLDSDDKMDNVALSYGIPSGWEYINERLDSNFKGRSDIDFMDIRDDRVDFFFSLKPAEKKEFELNFIASYRGKFYLPMAKAYMMYDEEVNANSEAKWVEVKD